MNEKIVNSNSRNDNEKAKYKRICLFKPEKNKCNNGYLWFNKMKFIGCTLFKLLKSVEYNLKKKYYLNDNFIFYLLIILSVYFYVL